MIMSVDRHTDQWTITESSEIEPDLWIIDFWQIYKGHSMKKGQSFQWIMLEQLDILVLTNESSSIPLTWHKLTQNDS